MAFSHRGGRNAAAAVASASFLALLVVFSVSLATRHGRHGGAGVFFSSSGGQEAGSCEELQSLEGAGARCRYLQSHPPCGPQGYADYLQLFYCRFGHEPWLGHAALLLWLLVLFYLLGDTASEYFCASLEGLSAELRLPQAIAGITFLSLGNGAPDVLSSVVAFAAGDGDAGEVGLSSVLGGALFVSTAVAGVVAIVSGGGGQGSTIERRGFVRDVCFLLVALGFLLAVLVAGTVTVWAAASFVSLYAAYVLLVWISHCCGHKPASLDLAAPLLLDDAPPPLPVSSKPTTPRTFARRLLDALRWPLYLPRRLTIPDIAAHRWSRPYAVVSALLSPLLLAFILFPTRPAVLGGALAGVVLAAAAALGTAASAQPDGPLARLAWLAGGFLMSILWSYLVARELVALLVAIGVMVGVKASVLGVTVLAWGNSLGDLVSDVAITARGGAQTAVSGCYAGPAFNTVVGLGLSLMLAAGARYPEPYAIPVDASVYVTVAFLVAGLVWALLVLPMRGMKLDRVLGIGLLLIYLSFLCMRVADSLGFLRLDFGTNC